MVIITGGVECSLVHPFVHLPQKDVIHHVPETPLRVRPAFTGVNRGNLFRRDICRVPQSPTTSQQVIGIGGVIDSNEYSFPNRVVIDAIIAGLSQEDDFVRGIPIKKVRVIDNSFIRQSTKEGVSLTVLQHFFEYPERFAADIFIRENAERQVIFAKITPGGGYTEAISIKEKFFGVIGRRGIREGRFTRLIDYSHFSPHVTIHVSRVVDRVVGMDFFRDLEPEGGIEREPICLEPIPVYILRS